MTKKKDDNQHGTTGLESVEARVEEADKVGGAASSASDPQAGSLVVQVFRWVIRVLAWGMILTVVAGYLGRWHPVLELCAQFMPYWTLAALVIALALLALRAWRTFTVAALALALAAAKVLPIYIPPATQHPEGSIAPLRVTTLNVEYPVRNAAEVFTYVAKSGPDIFTAQEITEDWIPKLSGLAEVYPHRIERHRPSNYGVILYSRYPMREVNVPVDCDLDRHAIAAILNIRGTEVLIVAVHAYQTRPLQSKKRIAQMQALANWLESVSLPKIVMGDFNVTPWSPHYDAFMAQTGLVSSRQGIGILPTYPTWAKPIMLPLDHCFVSRDIVVEHCARGTHVDSDHLPLEIGLMVPQQY